MVDCQRALAHSRGQRICGYTAGLRLLGRHLGPRCTFRLHLQLAEAIWQMSQCLGDSVSAQSHTIQILQIWRTWQMSHEQCLGDSVAAQIHTIQIVQIWRTWQMSQCLGDSVAAQIHTIQRQHVGPEERAASLPHACSCSRVMHGGFFIGFMRQQRLRLPQHRGQRLMGHRRLPRMQVVPPRPGL